MPIISVSSQKFSFKPQRLTQKLANQFIASCDPRTGAVSQDTKDEDDIRHIEGLKGLRCELVGCLGVYVN